MEFDVEAIFHKLNESGEAWADKEAAAEILEENKRSLLSDLMLDFTGSVAERERLALAHASYKDHLTAMVNARREANKARVRYDCLKVLAELRRTEASTRRAEMLLR